MPDRTFAESPSSNAAAGPDQTDALPATEAAERPSATVGLTALPVGAATDALAPVVTEAATLARAVAVAHANGVVHRDLKPGNVLFANGVPKITDFGLAKRLEGAESATGTGFILGTPFYMAPEQARGETRATGPAADIYALG